jgi:ribonuclease BN (tRNA processing enzyme)
LRYCYAASGENGGTLLVKITLIPSAHPGPHQYLTSYLVNDAVAIDAGSLGFYKSPQDQAAVRHLFLSHSHMDHLASLPIFLDNVAGMSPTPVTVHASDSVQECLRLDFFNGRVWPNFLELTHAGIPFVKLATIQSGQRVEVEGMRITPVAVNHAVPTLGFIIEHDAAAVVIASDTAPTEEIWAVAARTPNLKAVFLEATFPSAFSDLAKVSKHLTSAQFASEMQKLPRAATFYAVHFRARVYDQVAKELLAHGLPNLEIAEFGKTYEF